MANVIPVAGGNLIIGDNSDEFTLGTAVNDTVYGYAGDDFLSGGNGRDRVEGGLGNDYVAGGAGSDILLGGKGNDVLLSTYDYATFTFTDGTTFSNGIRDVLTGGLGIDSFDLRGDGNAAGYSYYEGANANIAGTTIDSFATVKDLQVGEQVFFASGTYDLLVQNVGTSVWIGYDDPFVAGGVGVIDDLIGVLEGVQVGQLSTLPANLTLDNTVFTITRTI